MNWKRGLFRVWLVITALWLMAAIPVTVTIIQRQDYSEVLQGGEPEQVLAGDDRINAFRNELRMRLFEGARSERRSDILKMSALVISVPLVLFGIGAAGIWVVSGFIKQS